MINQSQKAEYLKGVLAGLVRNQSTSGVKTAAGTGAVAAKLAPLLQRLRGLKGASGWKNLAAQTRSGLSSGWRDMINEVTGNPMSKATQSWAHNAANLAVPITTGTGIVTSGALSANQLFDSKDAAYNEGFAQRCTAYGVDPDALIKSSAPLFGKFVPSGKRDFDPELMPWGHNPPPHGVSVADGARYGIHPKAVTKPSTNAVPKVVQPAKPVPAPMKPVVKPII